MSNKQTKGAYCFASLVMILICIVLLWGLNCDIDYSNYYSLNDNWNIDINDEHYDNVSLQNFMFRSTGKGDVVKMTRYLPEDNAINNPVLRISSILSAVEVRYNGKVYYEYGKEMMVNNELLGDGFHIIHIPDDYAKARLDITFFVTENDAFSNVTIPQICNNDVIWRDFITLNRIPFVISLFLIVFGLLVIFASMTVGQVYNQFFKLICVGIFSIGIGFWSLCSYDLIMVFTYNMQMKTFLEYATLYIAPLFILLYFWGDTFITRNKLSYIIYNLLLLFQIIFDICAFTLQFTGLMHFPAVLKLQQIVLIGISVGIIGLSIYDIVKKQFEKSFMLVGMIVMMGFGLADMINFLVIKYIMEGNDNNYTSILCIGTMVFVISQIAELGYGIGKTILNDARTKMLEKMAYIDDMTGLANRRRCEEIWDSLDEKDSDYGIFSFDLNYLKKVNDTNGHAMGDVLIKSLASVLIKVFSNVGEVGRIGGDEYVVFIRNVNDTDIEKLTRQLEEEIAKTNCENKELNLSISYGFCSHKDYPNLNSRHIYRKADALMYEMKTAMKAARQD